MAACYASHPIVSFSIYEFIQQATRFFNQGDKDAFIRFILTGEYIDDEGHPTQAFVDSVRDFIDHTHPLTISRDYDSAIGIAPNIMVNGPISIYAVPHPTFALTSSIHIKYPIMHEGTERMVDFHRIPNFEFGTFGERHHLNIFFPLKWTPEHSKYSKPHCVSKEDRALWYENGLRPAIVSLLGHRVASEWPATYESEEIRARKSRGGHAWSTRIIQEDVVGLLAEQIRQELLGDPFLDDETKRWASSFFVMHTIRGVKHAHYHRYDEVSAEWYWNDFLKYAKLTDDVSTVGHWWVDVGIEISSDRQDCLQWLTTSHRDVAQEALRISDEDAQRITKISSSKYSRDLVSHLTAISGFRIVPGTRAEGVYQAAYLQAYTTDKATVYNTDGKHHAKFLTTKEALGQIHPTKTIDGIHSIYNKAVDVNHSKARLEIRVPFVFATQALLNFDSNILQGSLCSFSQAEWWSFRIMRLMGISQTLRLQARAPSNRRFHDEALTLTAACVWLVNGLHARPDDGPASRKLMDAVLPITEAADADTSIIAYNVSRRPPGLHGNVDEAPARTRKVPYNPHGCVFFRRLVVADGPRLRFGGPIISGPAFEFWFDGLDAGQLQAKYQTSGIIDKDVVADTRSTANRARLITNPELPDRPEPPLFNFTAQGLSLPPPIPDDASDVEDRLSPARENENEPQNIDSFASKLWGQFVSDITMKSPIPNGKTKPSYLKLTDIERRSGSEILYKTARLSDIFRCVYWRKADEKDWELSFKWLFPPHGYKTSTSVQNYLQSPYFRMWLDFLEMNNDDPGSIEAVRKGFFKRIRTWTWMPNAQGDRMWPTGGKKASSKRFIRWPADATRPPAPHILFKLDEEPIFEEIEADEQGQGDQEDEESGDE